MRKFPKPKKNHPSIAIPVVMNKFLIVSNWIFLFAIILNTFQIPKSAPAMNSAIKNMEYLNEIMLVIESPKKEKVGIERMHALITNTIASMIRSFGMCLGSSPYFLK